MDKEKSFLLCFRKKMETKELGEREVLNEIK